MSNLPITSRIKRIPKPSALKQTTDPKATVNSQVIIDEQVDNNNNDNNNNSSSGDMGTNVSYEDAYKNADKTKYPTFESFKTAAVAFNDKKRAKQQQQQQNQNDNSGSDINRTILDISNNEKVATTGDVMRTVDKRDFSRGTKKAGRDYRRSKIKLSNIERRLEKMDPKDKVKGNKKFDRLSAKLDENKYELKNFEAARDNQRKDVASGRKFGSNIVTGQRDVLLGEKGKTEQTAQNEARAKREYYKNLQANKNNITTGGFKQSAGAISADNSNNTFDFNAGVRDAINSYKPITDPTKNYDYEKGSKANTPPPGTAIFMKSSPNKKSSGFKMKGYGKK